MTERRENTARALASHTQMRSHTTVSVCSCGWTGDRFLFHLADAAIAADDGAIGWECSCGTPGLNYEGPEVDCDVHGLPSAAFAAGHELARQEIAHEVRTFGTVNGEPIAAVGAPVTAGDPEP